MRKFVLMAVVAATTITATLQSGNAETISQVSHYIGYTPDLVRYTVSKGHMPIILLGNPFSEEEILASLALPQFLPKAEFEPLPVKAAATTVARMVLVFDGARGFDGTKACRTPGAYASNREKAALTLWAAFCYRGDVLAEGHLAIARRDAASAEQLSVPIARLLDDVLTSDRLIVERGT